MNAVIKKPKKPAREGVTGKMFYINDQLDAALQRFVESQKPLDVSQTSIFETGLKMFLSSKGFWPPKAGQ